MSSSLGSLYRIAGRLQSLRCFTLDPKRACQHGHRRDARVHPDHVRARADRAVAEPEGYPAMLLRLFEPATEMIGHRAYAVGQVEGGWVGPRLRDCEQRFRVLQRRGVLTAKHLVCAPPPARLQLQNA